MKNPLIRRVPREFRRDIVKYLAIFVFMVLLIGMVSGFVVTDDSFQAVYDRGFTEQKLEDGHFAFSSELPKELWKDIEDRGNVTLHELFCFDEELDGSGKTVRVYTDQQQVNISSMLSGEMPAAADEIALDRMFADNNDIGVGDRISLHGRELTVCGLIARPDYSCLFEKNTDMMFDAINFSIGVMTQEGFDAFASSRVTYNYAWLYPEFVERTDTERAKELSEDFVDCLGELITEYDTAVMTSGGTDIITLTDYLPRYLNKAINFTGDDMGGDRATILVMDYVITLVLAFVFAITISGTIAEEAGVIGTLRASGYTRGELVRHYMILPVIVSLAASVVGNVLGYTLFSDFFIGIYYNSYSFPKYEAQWNADAFIMTTVVPFVLMLVINLYVLCRKLRLSPLSFLRNELGRSGKKRAVKLSARMPFIHRFRTRIIFQNIPNYLTLFFGIFIGGVLLVFGLMFQPLLDDYKALIVDERICDYQYVLRQEQETADGQAEKYLMTSLKTTNEKYMEDEMSVFGIEEGSAYVPADIADGRIAIASSAAEKFSLDVGDTIELRDPYNEKTRYTFEIGSVYHYSSGLALFMTKNDYAERFGGSADDFTGYFSNAKLDDLDEDAVAMVIDISDLTKMSDQMTVSVGEMMGLFNIIGIVIFVLLMYIMSRQIIEKNANSIAMTKILGFTNGEVGRLYIVATFVIVLLSLIITVPLVDGALRLIFSQYLYTMMTGYIPYIISGSCYVKLVVIGLVCYTFTALLQMFRISRIPKAEALKNVE